VPAQRGPRASVSLAGAAGEGPGILGVEVCRVVNQAKAVFDANASIYEADRSRVIPGCHNVLSLGIRRIALRFLPVPRARLQAAGGLTSWTEAASWI
jgi:hypothetical protein